MGIARDPSACPAVEGKPVAERLQRALDRAIRRFGVADRNRFGRLDVRMSPDRLALPAPLALLLKK
jgi:hypothetical protein